MTGLAPGALLNRLARRGPPAPIGERCELCAEPVGDAHGHVVDIERRSLRCACRPCELLFTADGAGHGRFRTIPDRVVEVTATGFGQRQWDALGIPVSVAFFFHHSGLGAPIAQYPGPGGATESQLPLDAWERIVAGALELQTLEPDVEAVLVHVPVGEPPVAFILPIDRCYALTGRLRHAWRGVGGGPDVARVVADEIGLLRRRSSGTA